jgi:L-cysteine:1D-myo-inositol 2-amino-2-deoxy-alpha-D-glucopyranoside ligase
VRHWTHVAMVNHDGEKMSKSLGNLVFVRDLVGRVPGGAVRVLLAQHHYRSSWTYNDAEVDAAAARFERYEAAISSSGTISAETAKEHERRFMERLDDDLDTPGALEALDTLAADLTAGREDIAPEVDGGALLERLLGILGAEIEPVAV